MRRVDDDDLSRWQDDARDDTPDDPDAADAEAERREQQAAWDSDRRQSHKI